MPNDSLNKEFAEFLATFDDLDLVLGTNLFYGTPDKNAGRSGKPVIVYVPPAMFPPNMQRLIEQLEDGEDLLTPTPGNIITDGMPGIVETTGPVTVKARVLPRVQVLAWGSDPGLVLAMVDNINTRVNQFRQDPAAPLVPGGKWDVDFIETDRDPELADYDRMERSAGQVRFRVSAFRRYQ